MRILSTAAAYYVLMGTPAMSFVLPDRVLPKLVLLDRDGVINEDVGSPGVIDKLQFELTPRAGNAIGTLKRCGCHVVVITNQSCVGKGLITIAELNHIHNEMQRLLVQQDKDACIDEIYFCTSVEDNPRKKPNPSMILEACRDFDADPANDCMFIGDTLTDMQASKAAGVQTRILVQTGYGFGLMGNNSALNPPQLIDDHSLLTADSELRVALPFYYATNLDLGIRHFPRAFYDGYVPVTYL